MSRTVSGQVEVTGPSSSVVGTIVGLAGMYRYATIPLKAGETLVIGRDAVFSHLVIDKDAEKVSRKHCEVRFLSDDRGWQVTDLSSNGTFLAGGRRLEQGKALRVPSGTEIYLGSKKNRFLLSSFSELTENLKMTQN